MATASILANDGDSDEQPASDPHDSFGPHVKRLRETRRLTQEELATRAGLAADTIRRLEYNEFSPSLRTLRKVVRGLGITLTTLVSSHELAEFEIPREIIGLLATRPAAEIVMVARIWQDLAAQLDARESGDDVQAAGDDANDRPTKDPFGSHVRMLRCARGLTQEVLAELSKLSADTIRRLERGSFSPSLDTLSDAAVAVPQPRRSRARRMIGYYADLADAILLGDGRRRRDVGGRQAAGSVHGHARVVGSDARRAAQGFHTAVALARGALRSVPRVRNARAFPAGTAIPLLAEARRAPAGELIATREAFVNLRA